MITLIEPIWWQNLLVMLNTLVSHDRFLRIVIPICADIIVFVYPFYLIYLYLKWYYTRQDHTIKLSITIFVACVITVCCNLLIQSFVIKSRPELYLDASQSLILSHLPTAPFPSDHAGISRAFFVSLALWSWILSAGIRSSMMVFFGLGSLIMCISRVAVGVHRPTDIIAGYIVASFVSLILLQPAIYILLDRIMYSPVVKFQDFLFRKLNIWNDRI